MSAPGSGAWRRIEAGVAENFTGMPIERIGALGGVLDDVEQVAVADVGVLARVVEFEHRRHRDAVLRAHLGPFGRGQGRGALLDEQGQRARCPRLRWPCR